MTALRLIQTYIEAKQKRSLYARVRAYRGFVPISYENEDFRVSTARTPQELLKVLELRHQVFIEEWQGRREAHGLDVDEYDFTADHLMITAKRTGEVVGTYRMLSSHFAPEFYSSSEFELEHFLALPGVKLELGRACVQAEYRNGATIDVLWRGLSSYIFKTRTEYLFGCSSVKTEEVHLINRLMAGLREDGFWSDTFQIRPTSEFEFEDFEPKCTQALTREEKRELLPPLLRSYLHAGAKAYGSPALDRDFRCTDILTILDWKKLNPRFHARFGLKE